MEKANAFFCCRYEAIASVLPISIPLEKSMIISFVLALLVFVAVGLSSVLLSKNTKQDYYLAGQSIPPLFVGLSAVATNNSGYMFIGAIGYSYTVGLSSIWLMVGWILGDFVASLFVHKKLRQIAGDTGEVTYGGAISKWLGGDAKNVQRVIGAISLTFLIAYAGAQFLAGSKAMSVLFDWPLWSGAVISAGLVIAYCLAGGIRASIWTDVAQSFVMLFAMGILLFVALAELGGVQQALYSLNRIESFMDLFPSDTFIPGLAGAGLFVLGWMFAGFSVAGQPHIMVRFMTLNDNKYINRARFWYYLWFTAFYAMAVCVGILSKLFFSDQANFDAELALPTIAQQLLHPALVGVVLAGIFAATMSTADSLVLNCSSSITHDLFPQKIQRTWHLKVVTVLVTLFALVWALLNSQSVFDLVIMAWSGLASAFVPTLFLLCVNIKLKPSYSIVTIFCGLVVALLWRAAGFHSYIYEGMPGILAGLAVGYVLHRLALARLARDGALRNEC